MRNRLLGDPVAVVVHTLVVLSSMSTYAVLPLLPILHHQLGLSASGLSILLALPSLTMIVFAVPAGWLCDRWGPRSITCTGAVLFCLSCLAQADGALVPFALGRLLFGVSLTAIWTGAPAWLRQTRTGSSGRVGAIVTSAALGTIAGPVVAGLLAEHVGFSATFLALGGVGALATIPFGFRRSDHRAIQRGSSPPWGRVLREVGRSPGLVAALAAMVAVGTVSGALQLVLPLTMSRAGASVSTIGLVFSAAGCVYVVASSLAARAPDSAITPGAAVLGCLAMAALVAPAGFSDARVWLVICLIGFTVPRAQLNTVSYRLAATSDLAETSHLGMVVGLLNLVWACAMTLGPIGAAWLDGAFGHGAAVIGAAAMPALIGVGLVVLHRQHRSQRRNQATPAEAEAQSIS